MTTNNFDFIGCVAQNHGLARNCQNVEKVWKLKWGENYLRFWPSKLGHFLTKKAVWGAYSTWNFMLNNFYFMQQVAKSSFRGCFSWLKKVQKSKISIINNFTGRSSNFYMKPILIPWGYEVSKNIGPNSGHFFLLLLG